MDKAKTFVGKLKQEFLEATDTLWKNEVEANLFVARILVYTAIMAALILVLNMAGVFSLDSAGLTRYLGAAIGELLVPAAICYYFKGEKPWLKVVLMLAYVVVLGRLHMVLGHNIVLCLVFPVALSVRYYSKPLTAFVAVNTILTYLAASYFGIMNGVTRADLNMVELPAGTVLNFPEMMDLRDAIDPSLIDPNLLFAHFFRHSFIPKFFLFAMIATVCVMIADRGRKMIFAQKEEAEKNERLSTELNLASDIQTNVLPNVFPVFPERKEFTLHASMTPAKSVGGDFYDFFFVDDDHIALVMADVSDKGIPAALFMMVARTLIKNRTMLGGSPAEILHDVNNQLCEGNTAGLFVTAWLGILELSTGKGIASNAGHEHPFVRNEGGEFKPVVYRHSLVLAAMEDMTFEEHEFQVRPGDSLFVYTDGVPEATNANKELFGLERLEASLNKDADALPEQLLGNVLHDIEDFVQDAQQFDDITMLALKYYGTEGGSETE